MICALCRYRSDHDARRAHPDGAVDCVCERSVWCFETRKISRYRRHGWMCHPKHGELVVRPRLKRFTRRYGMWPPRGFFTLKGRG